MYSEYIKKMSFFIVLVMLGINSWFFIVGCGVSPSNSESATKRAIDKLRASESLDDEAKKSLKTAEAFQVFEDVKTGDPNGAKNFYLIGQALLDLSYVPEAEKFLRLGIDVFPNANLTGEDSVTTWDGLHYTLQLLYRAKNDVVAAIDAIKPVEDRYPQVIIQLKLEQGYALYEEEKWTEALVQLEEVITLAYDIKRKFPLFDFSDYVDKASFYAVEVLSKENNKENDDKIFKLCMLSAESYPESYNIFSRFLKKIQKRKELDQYLKEVEKKADEDPSICLLTAKLWEKKGEKKNAKAYYEKHKKLLNR